MVCERETGKGFCWRSPWAEFSTMGRFCTDGGTHGWTYGRIDRWMDGRTDGGMHGCKNGWLGGWMDGWMSGWTGGRMDGSMPGCVDAWMQGCGVAWMEGWKDGHQQWQWPNTEHPSQIHEVPRARCEVHSPVKDMLFQALNRETLKMNAPSNGEGHDILQKDLRLHAHSF